MGTLTDVHVYITDDELQFY